MKIKIFTTGGTIDDIEYDSIEKAPSSIQSLVPKLIEQGNLAIDTNIEHLFAKDSKFIEDADRERICQKCITTEEEKIIVTHGTMTMTATAKYLGQKNLAKTIVLVGAMIPANHENSDALFNLGAAISVIQLLPHGVYIVMNGKIFDWNNVRKNLNKGMFEKEI